MPVNSDDDVALFYQRGNQWASEVNDAKLLRAFAWENCSHHVTSGLMLVKRKPFVFGKNRPAEDFLSIKSELMNRNIVAELSDFCHYRTLVLCRIEIM